MPGQFLTTAERERLSRFPPTIAADDLAVYFTLGPSDRQQSLAHRQPHNRLGFALQLCALRFLGFCPDDLTTAPAEAVQYVAHQLALAPEVLARYGQREQTRTAQLQEVQQYLGYRDASAEDLAALTTWLVARAQEHDKPTVLFQQATDKLQRDKIVRPGVTVLERLVATARERAYKETLRQLEPLLTPERRTWLDGLLIRDPPLGRTRFEWLKGRATGNTPAAILGAIAQIIYLRAQGVGAWDLRGLNLNRRKFLARLGTKSSAWALDRAPDYRRYPILVAFVFQALEELIDECLDLFDRYLQGAETTARTKLDEFHRTTARAANEKVIYFEEVGELILDEAIADRDLRPAIHQYMSPEKMRVAVDDCKRLRRPRDDNYYDFLAECYPTLRQFTPALLRTLTFRTRRDDHPLLEAVQFLQKFNAEHRRKIPDTAPLAFVPARWYSYLGGPQGEISRRYYELCLLWELRTALRAGNIWVVGSRRYADPDSYLIPQSDWREHRAEIAEFLGTPLAATARLDAHQQTLRERLTHLDRAVARQDKIRLEDGAVVVSPLEADDLPASTQLLADQVTARLPRLELADLLVEVDGWTRFSDPFVHAAGTEARTSTMQSHLYAVLLAGACNLGLHAMEHITEFSVDELAWCANWYVREETLRPAMVQLVNYQHHQPLAQAWGDGTLSSSDGQRFPVDVPARHAHRLVRYFPYKEQGVTFYSWSGDQWPQYGSKLTPVTGRDAPWVLDEILDNETELPISEHTTDTSGYTEMVFGLFDLLNLPFAPRIRDLPDQQLYTLPGVIPSPGVAPLFKGPINVQLIGEQWDELLRLAGSLKLGWVAASLMLNKLQTVPRKNVLARALQEYGRLVKTLFIVRYLTHEDYRRRIERQLNKGEGLHALRRFLFLGNWGRLRKGQPEDQALQALTLTLVTNAVVVWNTRYMAAVLDTLRAEGYEVREHDLKHLSPARHEHINPHGKYHFHVEEELGRQELRPLRRPKSRAPQLVAESARER